MDVTPYGVSHRYGTALFQFSCQIVVYRQYLDNNWSLRRIVRFLPISTPK